MKIQRSDEMYAFMVGYPIGGDSDGTNDTYWVEVDGKYISLNEEELAAWDSINIYSEEKSNPTYNMLKKKKICVAASSFPSLLSRMGSRTPMRQGSSLKLAKENLLLIADKRIPIDEVSLTIWRFSNGRRTVKEIYNAVKKMGILIAEKPEEHFMFGLGNLVSGNALFVS
jgi:hypothetical protein